MGERVDAVKSLVRLMFVSTLLLFLLVFISQFLLSLEAETIIVAQDGNGEYENIQDAIDNATEGDTISVWEGTYNENVVVNKSISLVGNGSEVTTIDCGGSEDVVTITSDWVNMSGFTITRHAAVFSIGILVESDHNTIFDNACTDIWTGIKLDSLNNTKIMNNIFTPGSMDQTHGITLLDSVNCTIMNNSCSSEGRGKGIEIQNSAQCIIKDNNCTNNEYGIFLYEITNCTISNNTSSDNRNGIYLDESGDCTIEYNKCSNNDKGIKLDLCTNITIMSNICTSNNYYGINLMHSNNCTIWNNDCSNNRDGINLGSSRTCTINNNRCENNNWGIYLESSHTCTIEYNNCSANNDWGIYLWTTITCTIVNNDCSNNDWGMYLHSSITCTIENNTCSSNNQHGIFLEDSHDNSFRRNRITGNVVGIFLLDSSSDNSAHNNIFNNTDFGIDASDNNDFSINATDNWWGASSGPYHPYQNPNGTGDEVTDDVQFEPWLKEVIHSIPKAHIDSISPNPVIEGLTITFEGHGTDDSTIIRYAWRTDITELYNGTETEFSYSTLPAGTHTIYFRVQDIHGVWSEEVSTDIEVTATVNPNQIPTITITQPRDGETVNGIVTLEGTVSDEDGNVTRIIVTILGTTTTHDNITINDQGNWTYYWDTGEIEDGRYWITVQCFDGFDYSVLVHLNITVENEIDNGGGGGFIPGFEAVAVVGAVGISIGICRWRRKRELERC